MSKADEMVADGGVAWTVHKMVLRLGDDSYIMPKGARILSVARQNGVPTLWYTCELGGTMETREVRTILVFGTGELIPDADRLTFIGTLLLADDSLVLHVFERVKEGD